VKIITNAEAEELAAYRRVAHVMDECINVRLAESVWRSSEYDKGLLEGMLLFREVSQHHGGKVTMLRSDNYYHKIIAITVIAWAVFVVFSIL
jgi:hypothetical protein